MGLIMSVQVIELYPKNLGIDAVRDLAQRELLCNFLGAIVSMAQARAHPDAEVRCEHYNRSRAYIKNFRKRLLEPEEVDEDCLEKHKTMLAFDFEAAVRLGQFDDLLDIVDEVQQYADEELCGILIDALLSSDAGVESICAVFQ
ncbi:hypothetical protein KEM55_001184, partial [Ascosphaera atra]